MTTCAIVVVDAGPLKTLAYGDQLNLLLKPGVPVFISDMVIQELRNGSQFLGNVTALNFIDEYLDKEITEMKTGVPAVAETLRSVGEDPGDTSIRRTLQYYYEIGCAHDSDDEEFALLISEDLLMMAAGVDKSGSTFLMTTRPFLYEARTRGWLNVDPEDVLRKAERGAIAAGEGPGRGHLDWLRERERNDPPPRRSTVKPF